MRTLLLCLSLVGISSLSSSVHAEGWLRRKLSSRPFGLFEKKKCCPSTLEGEEAPPWHPCRLREWPGKLYQGRGGGEHTFERAGYSCEVSRLAHLSNTPRYVGYYVGGGCAFKGGPPGPAQGTFGWDYGGICRFPKRIILGWCNRFQGGVGAYKTDGPDVFDVGPVIGELTETPLPGIVHLGESEGEGEGH